MLDGIGHSSNDLPFFRMVRKYPVWGIKTGAIRSDEDAPQRNPRDSGTKVWLRTAMGGSTSPVEPPGSRWIDFSHGFRVNEAGG